MKATRYFSSYIDAYNYYPNGVPSTEIAIVGDSSYILVSTDNANNGNTTFYDAGMTNDQIVGNMVDTAYATGTAYGEAIGYTAGHAAGYSEGYAYGYTEGEASGGGVTLDDDYFCVEFFDGNSNTPLTSRATTLKLTFDTSGTSADSFDINNFQYSFDKENWTDITFDEDVCTISTSTSNGNKVYLKGYAKSNKIETLRIGDSCSDGNDSMKVSGNLLSLFYGENYSVYEDYLISSTPVACKWLFAQCNVKDASGLVMPSYVTNNSFEYMFYKCSFLTSAPALPATTLANDCYTYMFCQCTSLTTAPELPATTLAEYCYYRMFYGCTSLTASPVLSATTLASGCYGLMFTNCTALTSITCLATDITAEDCLSNWVMNVAASGIFYKNSSMTGWSTGISGVPSGWIIENYVAA